MNLNLKGMTVLNKEQLKSIHAGYSVTCYFNDGTSWTGSTSSLDVVDQMEDHCRSSPGVLSIFSDVRNQ